MINENICNLNSTYNLKLLLGKLFRLNLEKAMISLCHICSIILNSIYIEFKMRVVKNTENEDHEKKEHTNINRILIKELDFLCVCNLIQIFV